jgi:undecaprenyl-diphosphatase
MGTPEARLGWYIVLGTIPAVVFGLLFKSSFEAVYQQPIYVAALLFGTALMLVLAELRGRQRLALAQMRAWDALDVGLWQVAAMLPGISRSGATVAGAMLRDFERPAAARFSFLLSVPALVGAGVLAIKDLFDTGLVAGDLPALLIGFLAAAVSGYLCIRWLLGYLQRHSLIVFAAYCAVFGAACLIVAWVRG